MERVVSDLTNKVKPVNLKILESLKIKYYPVIQDIIDGNSPFYQFANEVYWSFVHNDNIAVIATCNSGYSILRCLLSAEETHYVVLNIYKHVLGRRRKN